MFLKVIFTIVCVLTAAQSRVSYTKNEALIAKDQELIRGIIDELEKLVNEAIAKAKEQLEKLKNEIQDEVNAIVNDVTNQLNTQIQDLINKLKELKDKAAELGVDITECLTDKEQELVDLPFNFAEKIVQCGKDEAEKGAGIINDAFAIVEKRVEEVEKLVEESAACLNLPWYQQVQCQVQVAAEAAVAVIKIPAEITGDIANAVKFIATIKIELTKCGLDKVNEAVSEGTALLGDITKCIEDKINPSFLKLA